MKIDRIRIKKFLSEIQKDTIEIEDFLKGSMDDKRTTKAIKYNLIEITEAQANVLQHILAKGKGIPASGYLEVIESAKTEKIVSQRIYEALKPFFEFRNTLVHKYWTINDNILIKDLKANYQKFYDFIKDIEEYLKKTSL